jgi:hypothetical protein
MQITVVAVMCHALGAISQPVCREEIVVKDDMPMQACFLSQSQRWPNGKSVRCSAVSNGPSAASSAYPATTRPRTGHDFAKDVH